MSYSSGLTIRQHQREDLELEVEFVVCEEHAEQVRFSPTSTTSDERSIRGVTSDLSTGGMGLICRQYLPRMCEGHVRVFDPTPLGTRSDGSPILDVAFEHEVKVRRVTLLNHEPTYALGVSFVDPEPDLEQRLERCRRLVAGEGGTREGGDA
jgi:c-di-GMP-binding flagellar brake protein YcgR